MTRKLLLVVTLIALAALSAVAGEKDPHGRWPGDVSHQEHHRKRGEFIRPHHVSSSRKGRRTGGNPRGNWSLHSLRAHQRSLQQTSGRHCGHAAKTGNKATLTKVLTYHVVAGRLSAHDLMKQIKEGNGTAQLTTVEGGKLWVTCTMASTSELKDEKGGTAMVTIANVFQSNGVIHVIDSVVMPN